MNTIDIILGIVLLYGLIRGFFRGLFAEVAALVGLIAGIYGAIYFSHILSDFLANHVNWDEACLDALKVPVPPRPPDGPLSGAILLFCTNCPLGSLYHSSSRPVGLVPGSRP